MANGFQLHQGIGNAQKHSAAGEEFPSKIGAQAIAQHRDPRLVSDARGLINSSQGITAGQSALYAAATPIAQERLAGSTLRPITP